MQRARGFFRHVNDQIDLVGRARHLLRLDADLGEEAQPVHAVAREADLLAVVPRGLELAELAPDDFVARAVVARHLDAAHGLQDQGHAVVLAVDLGHGLDARESKAEVAEMLGKGLGGLGDLVGVVRLAGADGDQRLELVLALQEVAFELDARDDEALALGHVDGDGDVLLVRRDGDLSGIHAELQVAALQIVRTQGFEVGVELRARIAVALGVPAQPAARVLVEQALEGGFAEGLVADDADVLDARRLALGDGEGEVHPVAFYGRDGGDDFGAVEALVDVLALELLLGAVGQRLVVGAAIGQADVAHGLLEHVLVELARTGEVHVGDGRALLDDDHEHAAHGFQAHVLEQAQGKQRADRGSALLVVVFVAHAQGNGREHRSGFNALQAFHADVLDLEGVERPGSLGGKDHGCNGRHGARTEAMELFFHE